MNPEQIKQEIISDMIKYIEDWLMMHPSHRRSASSAETPIPNVLHADSNKLDSIAAEYSDCKLCRLHETRTNIVSGAGGISSGLLIIGEAPGAEEDKQGLPFVGASGELLTKMLSAINLSREEVFITNIVKCRPPGNRQPNPDEISACKMFLLRQISEINPKLILLLGSVAAKTLLGDDEISISKIRGRVFKFQNIPCIPSYHPAYLLRKPAAKSESWTDLKLVKKMLNES